MYKRSSVHQLLFPRTLPRLLPLTGIALGLSLTALALTDFTGVGAAMAADGAAVPSGAAQTPPSSPVDTRPVLHKDVNALAAADVSDGYAGQVLNKICRFWSPPQENANRRVGVRLRIDGNGKLLQCVPMTPSDLQAMNKAACDAADEAGDFGRPPYGREIDIFVTFWSGRASRNSMGGRDPVSADVPPPAPSALSPVIPAVPASAIPQKTIAPSPAPGTASAVSPQASAVAPETARKEAVGVKIEPYPVSTPVPAREAVRKEPVGVKVEPHPATASARQTEQEKASLATPLLTSLSGRKTAPLGGREYTLTAPPAMTTSATAPAQTSAQGQAARKEPVGVKIDPNPANPANPAFMIPVGERRSVPAEGREESSGAPSSVQPVESSVPRKDPVGVKVEPHPVTAKAAPTAAVSVAAPPVERKTAPLGGKQGTEEDQPAVTQPAAPRKEPVGVKVEPLPQSVPAATPVAPASRQEPAGLRIVPDAELELKTTPTIVKDSPTATAPLGQAAAPGQTAAPSQAVAPSPTAPKSSPTLITQGTLMSRYVDDIIFMVRPRIMLPARIPSGRYTVGVTIQVDSRGMVGPVTVVQSSGHMEMDNAVVLAVGKLGKLSAPPDRQAHELPLTFSVQKP